MFSIHRPSIRDVKLERDTESDGGEKIALYDCFFSVLAVLRKSFVCVCVYSYSLTCVDMAYGQGNPTFACGSCGGYMMPPARCDAPSFFLFRACVVTCLCNSTRRRRESWLMRMILFNLSSVSAAPTVVVAFGKLRKSTEGRTASK